MAASDRKDQAKATMTSEEIRQSTDVAKLAELLKQELQIKFATDKTEKFHLINATLNNIIKSKAITPINFATLKLAGPELISKQDKPAFELYQRLKELKPLLQKQSEAKYPELRNKTLEQIQQLAIDFLNRFNDPIPKEIREDKTLAPFLKTNVWQKGDGSSQIGIDNPDAIHFEGYDPYFHEYAASLGLKLPLFDQNQLLNYSPEAELPEDFIKLLNDNKIRIDKGRVPRQVLNNLDVIFSLAQYQQRLFFIKETIFDYANLYKNGEKIPKENIFHLLRFYRKDVDSSAENKDPNEIPAFDINNLLICYKLALATNPEKLAREDALAIGGLLIELLNYATPGPLFKPDYAKVLASLSNYNDVLLHAIKLYDRAEMPNTPVKNVSKKDAALAQDIKDGAAPERTIYIPNFNTLIVHLLRSTYESDDKDQKNIADIVPDKIIKEKGEELAKNFEKRERLSLFFAQNEAWKQLTHYIQKELRSGTKGDFLDNLIKQKLSCEAELDNGKRDEFMQKLQTTIQKEMAGKGFGLWSNSISTDLLALNNAFKQPAPEKPKVKFRLRERE